jgi:hypothetical protein
MYWDYITEIVPEGSTIGWMNNIVPMVDAQLGSGITLTMVKLFQKECKIICFSLESTSPTLTTIYLNNAEKILGRELVYGVDYVELGYIPGMEAGLAAFLSDIPGFLGGRDMRGDSIAGMPILEGIKDGGDMKDAVWGGGYSVNEDFAIRQWQVPYGTRLCSQAITMVVPSIVPYLATKQFYGILSGLRGSAELELLMKEPGNATGQLLGVSFSALYFVFILLLGNIIYAYEKITMKEEKR